MTIIIILIPKMYFSIPLKQGLRLILLTEVSSEELYFSIPLKQGLRQSLFAYPTSLKHSILVFH